MNTTKEGIEVKPGQIWRDLDKRMGNREICITAVSGGFAHGVQRSSTCGHFVGRKTRISIQRMHKHSTGWELVKP